MSLAGIEPAFSHWKSDVLPLYQRNLFRDERIRTFINNFEDYSFTVKLHLRYISISNIKSGMKGLEPLLLTLEANVLPLNYIPKKI